MDISLHLLREYRIKLVAMELPCIGFTFQTRIFCRDVSGFVIGWTWGVWCRRLTICLPKFGPIFSKSSPNNLLCELNRMDNSLPWSFKYVLIVIIDIHIYIYNYLSILLNFYFPLLNSCYVQLQLRINVIRNLSDKIGALYGIGRLEGW